MNGFNSRKDSRPLILTISTLACMAFVAWASGQPQPQQRAQTQNGQQAQAPQQPTDEPKLITLYIGHSQVIRAPWPVKRTSITDEKVANVEILTADQILLQGKTLGTTDLIMWSSSEEIWRARVEVVLDLSRLKSQLTSLLPDAVLDLQQNNNVIMVTGTLRRTEDTLALHQYFKAIKLAFVDGTRISGVQQVLLQVRVAEANRISLRALGINALKTGSQDNTFFGSSTPGPSSGGNINTINMGPPEGAIVGNEGVPFVFNSDLTVSPLVTMNLGFPRGDLQFLLQALSENQYLSVLAEPNLVAQSGEEATFLAGGEFPIPIAQGNTAGVAGGVSITIQFKEFGIRLRFRPLVLGDGLIRLHVAPEVSELTDQGAIELQGFRIPGLRTRRAATTLEMHSGQTFSMAGLIDRRTEAIASRIPALGDIPILGSLFRSVRYRDGETEMVVLVTVSLVEPLSQKSLPPLPGMTHRRPNDWELFLCGQLEGSGPSRLSSEEAEWLRRLGFDGLRGPGAWATYGEEPPRGSSVRNSYEDDLPYEEEDETVEFEAMPAGSHEYVPITEDDGVVSAEDDGYMPE